ncbi:MAG: HD domain-containing protein [Candidatus Edwardsbacteria bacterium]|nr:HD domain-containing protein [Candidatus Edwardsbacteria bacterium]
MEQCGTVLEKLVKIGIALSSVRDLNQLLDIIVTQARELANCDAGSLYIKEGDSLKFVVSQNDTLARKLGQSQQAEPFKPFNIPISNQSLSGYVANNGVTVNIPDAYRIPQDAEYHFDKSFDQRSGYRTCSMIQLPMKDNQGGIIGVLQLINAMAPAGQVIPFGRGDEELLLSMASQAAVAIKNAKLNDDIREAHLDTIFRLGIAAEYRDKETGNHIRRMSHYSAIIAEKMGMPPERVELIRLSSPMHDIGKVGIPDGILLKPGRLTPEERIIMESHTTIGAGILKDSNIPLLQLSRKVALSHHEKWDGTGYPDKVKGEDIPLEGRIVALADVFDALSNKRVYKAAMSIEETMGIIKDGSGTHFDPAVIAAFEKGMDGVMEIYQRYKEI